MSVADPERNKVLLKHRCLEFFRMGGFLYLDMLGEEQKKLMSDASDLMDDETMWDVISEAAEVPRFGNQSIDTGSDIEPLDPADK